MELYTKSDSGEAMTTGVNVLGGGQHNEIQVTQV